MLFLFFILFSAEYRCHKRTDIKLQFANAQRKCYVYISHDGCRTLIECTVVLTVARRRRQSAEIKTTYLVKI